MGREPITRRAFLVSAVPVSVLVGHGCSSPEPAAPAEPVDASTPTALVRVKLTAAIGAALCRTDWFVAQERGFFAEEGLDVEFLPIDPAASDLTTGMGHQGPVETDIGVAEYPQLVNLASEEGRHYVVAGEHSGCMQLIAPIDSPAETIADLKGKRIGRSVNYDTLQWEFLARQAGLAPADLTWVSYSNEMSEFRRLIADEFASGRVDAFFLPDPIPEILKAEGIAKTVASNTWTEPLSNMYCCMLVVRRDLHDQLPGLSQAFARAIRRATALIDENAAEAVRIAVDGGYLPADLDQEIAARLLVEYVWTNTGRIEQDLERYFEILIADGRIPAEASPKELVARVYRGVE